MDSSNGIRFEETLCPVCDSKDYSVIIAETRREPKPKHFKETYVRCHECRMIYLNPAPSWDELGSYYDQIFDSFTNREMPAGAPIKDQKGFMRQLYHRLFRFQPHSWPQEEGNGRKLLDIGCGNANRLVEFAERGWEIFGVDVSASALTVARRTVPQGTFLEGELKDVDLPLDSFDVIRMDNVLEHVLEPKRLLHRCCELLNSQGRLYTYVPHGRSLSVRLFGKYSYSAWAPLHLYLFTVSTLERMLSDAGFSAIKTLQFCPYSWIPSSLKLWLGIQEHTLLPTWVDRGLMLMFLPVGYIASRIGWGEELVAIAQK